MGAGGQERDIEASEPASNADPEVDDPVVLPEAEPPDVPLELEDDDVAPLDLEDDDDDVAALELGDNELVL